MIVSRALNDDPDQAYLVEGRSTQMHVLHEHQEVKPRVAQSLHEACLDSLARLQANGVPLDAVMCKLALLWREPLGGERLIRQKPNADNRDANGHNTFDDEEPDVVSIRTGN